MHNLEAFAAQVAFETLTGQWSAAPATGYIGHSFWSYMFGMLMIRE